MSAAQPAGMCHLLVADDALGEGHAWGTYVAVCGELVTDLLPGSCPPGGECDPRYCLKCVREALSWNAEAGQADRHPSGRSGSCPVLPLRPDRRQDKAGR